MTRAFVCSICQRASTDYGNNAWPINMGRCCDHCNWTLVVPARIELLRREEQKATNESEGIMMRRLPFN